MKSRRYTGEWTPERRAKISAALMGKPKSAAARAHMSAAKKGRPALNKGMKMSPEQKINSGRKIGSIPWNKGKKTGHAPWLGKKRGPHSAETKAKMSLTHTGRSNSLEHNANIAAARMGIKHTAATIEKIKQSKRANPYTMPAKEIQKLRDRWMGRKNPAWGTTPIHGPRTHWVDYNGTKLRSSYEVRLAKAFDIRGIKWEYEPRRFDLGVCTYLPDFYLPELKMYWEVKGWLDPKSQLRINLFREIYSTTPLVVATNAVIKMMERQ